MTNGHRYVRGPQISGQVHIGLTATAVCKWVLEQCATMRRCSAEMNVRYAQAVRKFRLHTHCVLPVLLKNKRGAQSVEGRIGRSLIRILGE